jgi:thioredoxin reductase (NADPH)
LITTDVVIVGAGPCGLFQVFELGLLGLKSEIIDSIRQPGGQCTELYPDKPIYDIPAIPMCTGEELTDGLLKQIEPFEYGMHLGEEVTTVERQDDSSFVVGTSAGQQFHAKAVVVAGGVGSFQPRAVRAAGVDNHVGTSLHYSVKDPNVFAGKKLVIFGGGDSALDWAIELAGKASHITLVHRRDEYRAVDASVRKIRSLADEGKIDVFENSKVTEFTGAPGDLTAVTIANKEGETTEISVDCALVFFGLAPKLGPIAEWGLDMNRKTINVNTETFETSEPGVYAVGDINHYPGKKKLILCGFHEAALAAFAIKQRIEPDKKVYVQYTTTSPIMHERLGVED